MILIAESGSTKVIWALLNRETNQRQIITTSGINPFYQNREDILELLHNEFKVVEREFEAIFFYGAGCANSIVNETVSSSLHLFFKTPSIHVYSDLRAAAHALCGEREGIACILGTGSNSCHYKEGNIVKNVSPLGFILGDEGSGAVIGKMLLSDILKDQLPSHIVELFFKEYPISSTEILENIYKKPFPNRYAAQFTKFISAHLDKPELVRLVEHSFDLFITRNILQYTEYKKLPIHFTGSIAYHFQTILEKSLKKHELQIGSIVQDPMDGLMEYHLKNGGLYQQV